jgi:hypothetical protein
VELVNATPFRAGYTLAQQRDGRELVLVVVKGTFTIPAPREVSAIADEQVPLVEADQFLGEPGLSAPLYESDYAPLKPACDVLLHGSAYAPFGEAIPRVRVSLAVASMRKAFDVVGPRVWRVFAHTYGPSEAEAFVQIPISYGSAFGGTDRAHPDPARHETYLANHVGVGYHVHLTPEVLDGQPLPNTEEPGHPVISPSGDYRPMAFGPLGRAWTPRAALAGTYDDAWLDERFPFLPEDFDERYFQSAPDDQQIAYPVGGERVILTNLTADGETRFALPDLSLPVTFFLRNYERHDIDAVVDTLIIEPDLGRFMVTWKAMWPLKRNVFEVAQAVAGTMPAGWYRARAMGKEYFPSLSDLARARQELP